jgi:hypothetical protein
MIQNEDNRTIKRHAFAASDFYMTKEDAQRQTQNSRDDSPSQFRRKPPRAATD